MDELEHRRIACLLDDISDEELWGGTSFTDECSPDEHFDVLETSNTEQSGESTDDEIHNDIQQTLSADCESYHESDDEIPLSMRVGCFYGKDGTKWNRRKPNLRTKNPSYNKITEKKGVTNLAKNAKTEIDAWYIFFTGPMIEHIVFCTNIYIDKIKSNFTRERDVAHTTTREIKDLLGCLYMIGAIKCGHRNARDLWKLDGVGVDIVSCVMSEKRFEFLLRYIRFDDIRRREERKKFDKITHVRWLFESFILQCKQSYSLSEFVTIDEKLQAFRGRCSFRHIDNSPKNVVHRLIQPIRNTGRNVTIDNWFTSVPLADELLNQKLTLLGTFRKNKTQIPQEFKITKNRPVFSSYFGFSGKKVLVSYKPKNNKIVLLLSTMHNDNSIDSSTGAAKKPNMITMYNATKGSVDTMDKKTENYTVARRCIRWSLIVFYSMLNIGGLSAQIIFQENTSIRKTRLVFLKTLARQLMQEQMEYRLTLDCLPKQIKLRLNEYCNITRPNVGEIQRVRASGRCTFCDRSKDRKATKVCTNCARLICRDHIIETCPDCFEAS
ncbi:uncharacterized protein LOC132936345 [Metopolophium dirhodum]|uniref:uncharacterized protein LOC132936345 n=1 Tax=Metopolophium dirhodum TaxID=44670 RepID=UPI0029906FC8|nr:uncharacterized protein LOC132936345 [Metopolophium dirhodum]